MGRRRRQRSEDLNDSLEQRYYSSKRIRAEDSMHDEPTAKKEKVVKEAKVSRQNAPKKNVVATLAEASESKKSKSSALDLNKTKSVTLKQTKEKAKGEEKKPVRQEKGGIQHLAKGKKKTPSDASSTSLWTALRQGVKYQDLELGRGQTIRDRKKVRVKYTLRAKSFIGKILDSSDSFGFRVRRGEVIEGWDIGLTNMRQGGRRRLMIPPQAGYGQRNIGAGKGGMLYFDITLLSC